MLSLVLFQKGVRVLRRLVLDIDSAVVVGAPQALLGRPGLVLVDVELLDQEVVFALAATLAGDLAQLDDAFADEGFEEGGSVGESDETMLAT